MFDLFLGMLDEVDLVSKVNNNKPVSEGPRSKGYVVVVAVDEDDLY